MALDVGEEDINTMHGKIIGWEKLLVHSIYRGSHYTFTGHTGERAERCTVFTVKCRQAMSGRYLAAM